MQRAFADDAHPTQVAPFPEPDSDACGEASMFDAGHFSTPLEGDLSLITSPTLRVNGALDSLLSMLPETDFDDGSWQSNLWGQHAQVSLVSKEIALTEEDYLKMWDMCVDYQPWQATDPSTKIGYVLKLFKNLHVTFAREYCAPHIHRYLYKDHMPQFILQAFSVCMLYTNKTDANRGIILRVLHDNVTTLLASSGATTLTPLEKLARVQVLIFYQTIRMFDGDITLGQQAGNDFKWLQSWIGDLCGLRDNLVDSVYLNDAALGDRPPQSWERWIFAESLRRTVIMGYVLKALWDLLKGGESEDAGVVWAQAHRWTLSGHLWNAPGSFEFFRAWREKPLWIVSSFKFEEFAKTGTGDDLDEFAQHFLTLYFGVSEIKTFCYETRKQGPTSQLDAEFRISPPISAADHLGRISDSAS
ncbi:hypothetical protein DL771_001980 [Monosporascus sp. 5C6A]|nr:hypothetical protein DL771_001980 [Monosporascus sp. 5C6A]